MGKKSRRIKGADEGKQKGKASKAQVKATRQLAVAAAAAARTEGGYGSDDSDQDGPPRPFQTWYGNTLVLEGVSNPAFRGKEALCVGYDDGKERLIVWTLGGDDSRGDDNTCKEILIQPGACAGISRYDVEACRREVRQRPASSGKRDLSTDEECSICLECPRAPVELPCSHTFCASCLSRLRPPRCGDFEVRCPNCRAEVPAMLGQMLEEGDDLVKLAVEKTYCFSPGCAACPDPTKRHSPGGNLLTEATGTMLKGARDRAAEENDILHYVVALESLAKMLRRAATPGDPAASKVKAHRDLMRGACCALIPRVQTLRKQWEGCLQIQSACGGIDSKLEELWMEVYGRPLLTPEEIKEKVADSPSMIGIDVFQKDFREAILKGENVKPEDMKMNDRINKLVIENFEACWYYIRSFGVHYDRVLGAFANTVGVIASDKSKALCQFLDGMCIDDWAMRRLDALEDLLAKEGAYGKFEAKEAFILIQLIFNIVFVTGSDNKMDSFIRTYGQDYLLREVVGAIDPCMHQPLRPILEQLRRAGMQDEFGRPLVLLRPCAVNKEVVGAPEWCRRKESHEKEFQTCKCGRKAYCSPLCRKMHEEVHASACKEALRARERLSRSGSVSSA